MKRRMALLMALTMLLALAACGNTTTNNQGENDTTNNSQQDQTDENENGDLETEEPTEPELPTEPEDGEDEAEPEEKPETKPEEDKEEETTKPAEGLTLSSKDFTLFSAGSSYKLTVTGAKGDVTFTSSNEKVATVAKDGTVTAVAPGRADITVTSGKDKASCVVRCKWEESKPETKPEEKPEESTSVDLSAFYSDMTATYEFGHLEQFTGDVLESYYAGMGAVSTKQCLVMGTMMSMNNGEFCLVEVSDSKDVDTVKSIFQARIDFMVDGGAWYPGPTEQWTNNSRVVSNGNYVMMVVHENCDDIVDAFNALF